MFSRHRTPSLVAILFNQFLVLRGQPSLSQTAQLVLSVNLCLHLLQQILPKKIPGHHRIGMILLLHRLTSKLHKSLPIREVVCVVDIEVVTVGEEVEGATLLVPS